MMAEVRTRVKDAVTKRRHLFPKRAIRFGFFSSTTLKSVLYYAKIPASCLIKIKFSINNGAESGLC